MSASELMSRNFLVFRSATSTARALEIFQEATELEGRRLFGLMMADDDGHLVGSPSMYDILNLLQPNGYQELLFAAGKKSAL